MNGPRDIVPHPAGCPYEGWTLPDIAHCEENLCAWITAPADTWSNLAYIAAGLWLWRRGGRASRLFAVTAFVVGATSFAFHASYTFAGQVLDYAGMFAYLGVPLALNLARRGSLDRGRVPAVALAVVGVGVGGVFLFRALGWPVQTLIGLLVAVVVTQEIRLARAGDRADRRPLYAGIALSAAGFGLWQLEYHRVLCDPTNHWLQPHAVWHLLTAAAFLPLAEFYDLR